MDLVRRLRERAKSDPRVVVLPEGYDARVVAAAVESRRLGLAKPVLIGAPDVVRRAAEQAGVDAADLSLVDPTEPVGRAQRVARLLEIRRHKGLFPDEAQQEAAEPFYVGALMVRDGQAEGLVGGCTVASQDMLRPVLQVIGVSGSDRRASSAIVVVTPNRSVGEDGVLLFADVTVNPDPHAGVLASIAVESARTARWLLGWTPRVALLSFSTHGSAEHANVGKVRGATFMARQRAPEVLFDGELQLDAAIVPAVAQRKAPQSPLAGRANVLVFPCLEAANIGLKLVERIAGAHSIGPVLQGLAKPANDLTRGASVEDVVDCIAMMSVQIAYDRAHGADRTQGDTK
jgi:phosphate acetyltransferase